MLGSHFMGQMHMFEKYRVTQKTESVYFWLKLINLILAFYFFSGYEVGSVHEKLGP